MLIWRTDSHITSTDFSKGLCVCKRNKYQHCAIQYGGQRLANSHEHLIGS